MVRLSTPVSQPENARREVTAFDQFEVELFGPGREEGLATAHRHWVHPHPELVNKVDQRRRNFRATDLDVGP